MSIIPDDYYSKLAHIESGNDPNAKAPTSSASGLYQFVKSTWQQLGYNWADVFSVDKQNAAIRTLTTQNANALNNAGIDVNDASLYAAHFFGVGTAEKVLGAGENTPVSSLVSKGVLNANSFLKGMTVSDFKDWLAKKTGTTMSSDGSLNSIVSAVTGAASTVGGAISGAGKATTDAIGITGNSGLITWVENLFSAHTAARFSAVLIGVILVALAIAAFLLTSNTNLTVTKAAV